MFGYGTFCCSKTIIQGLCSAFPFGEKENSGTPTWTRVIKSYHNNGVLMYRGNIIIEHDRTKSLLK